MKGIWYREPSWFCRAVRAVMGPLGRAANHVDWRLGRPYKTNAHDLEALRTYAVPGSVVLTHTDYNLANLLIPGYWDHATLVADGRHVVEAVGEGVRLKTFEELLAHCDDICILEPTFADAAMMSRAVDNALGQLGRPYDFDFDYRLEGDEAFYCSELVWWSYDQACKPLVAPFQPGYILGQWTLCPQNIFDSDYMAKIYLSKEAA
jgi:uncharacterized protein YycO